MTSRLIFIHGRRSAERDDPEALRREWIGALREGLARNDKEMPVAESDIEFPYYGDLLFQLVGSPRQTGGLAASDIWEDEVELRFLESLIGEIALEVKATDDPLAGASIAPAEVGPQGLRERLATLLAAIEKKVPGASGLYIFLVTKDVHRYLNSSGIRDAIELRILQAFKERERAVVVGHSLGSIVAYNLLRREGPQRGWSVPLFVTLGSPLGLRAIRSAVQNVTALPCVEHWYNASDRRDLVALHPLDKEHFPVTPPVENNRDIDNNTPNHHGISGYLSDPIVANQIYDSLTNPTPT